MPEPNGLPQQSRKSTLSAASRVSKFDNDDSELMLPASGSLGQSPAESTMPSSSRRQSDRTNFWQRFSGESSKRSSRRAALRQSNGSGSSQAVSQSASASRRVRSLNSPENVRQVSFDQPQDSTASRTSLRRRRSSRLDAARSQGSLDRSASRETGTLLRLAPATQTDEPNRTTALTLRRDSQRRSERSSLSSDRASSNTGRLSASTTRKSSDSASQRRDRLTQSKPRHRTVSIALYAARMLILSVGVGVLAGTLLSAWDPASNLSRNSAQATKQTNAKGKPEETTISQLPKLGQEIAALKPSLQTLITKNPKLMPGLFLFDLDNNSYLDINGSQPFSAASTIKVPVLVAFFQDVDAGKIRLDEVLTMRKDLMASGSGDMQYQGVGTKYTTLETASKMITISDNTATNMLIERLGGKDVLNQRFQSWGLTSTVINNKLPDLEGTNLTSPKDLSLLMTRISQGELMSLRSRDRMLGIMHQTVTRTLLPSGLGEGATIAHKTGDIGTMVGDVGLIDLPNGKRYAATVLVKRSHNDEQAQELIRQISRTSYQYFIRPPVTLTSPSPQGSPAGQASPNPGSEAPGVSPSSTGSPASSPGSTR